MVVDSDEAAEAAKPPTQPLNDLIARQRGEEPVGAGILAPVEHLHRYVQKELVTGVARCLCLPPRGR